jgi:hypothetical protein
MAFPSPPSQFTEEEIEAQGGESYPRGHPTGSIRAGIGSEESISLDVSTRAETIELEGKSLKAPVTVLCPSLHNVTTVLCPSLHNVTVLVSLLCTMSPSLCPSYTMSPSLWQRRQVHYRISSTEKPPVPESHSQGQHWKELEGLCQASPLLLEKLRPR